MISFDSYASGMRAVEQGVGVGLGLLPLVQSWIDAGRVVPVLDAPVAVPESMWLVFPSGGARQAQLVAVGRLLRDRLASPSQRDG